MKVRRKPARPWDGDLSKLPSKVRLWMEKNPEHKPTVSQAVYPVCEAVRWMKHGDHPKVRRIPNDHPNVHELRAKGKRPEDHGHCENMAGHLRLVEPGDHIVDYPNGLIHHGNEQGKDITPYYDVIVP
jgi:hypothetical protein